MLQNLCFVSDWKCPKWNNPEILGIQKFISWTFRIFFPDYFGCFLWLGTRCTTTHYFWYSQPPPPPLHTHTNLTEIDFGNNTNTLNISGKQYLVPFPVNQIKTKWLKCILLDFAKVCTPLAPAVWNTYLLSEAWITAPKFFSGLSLPCPIYLFLR